jgi:hypothetical protein
VSPAQPAPSWWTTPRTIGVVTGGAGVGLLILGGIFAAQSQSAAQDAARQQPCTGDCSGLQSNANTAHTANLASWTLTGFGTAALATGAVLVFWPTAHGTVSLAPAINPAGLQLLGIF